MRQLILWGVLSALALHADFRYEQTSRMGGAMTSGVMGMMMRGVKEPQTSTVYYKGDRMASVHQKTSSVLDFTKETITLIDHEKKTYSTMTFAEMAQYLDEMGKKMKAQMGQQDQQVQGDIKIRVEQTGAYKNIAGVNADQIYLIMEMTATDPKTGQTATIPTKIEMWMSDKVPGYQEVQQMYTRLAAKGALQFTNSSANFLAAFPGMRQSMEEMQKESGKMKGIPMLTIMRYGDSMGGPGGTAQMPSSKDVASGAATSAAAGALGRLGRGGAMAGGLGGLGGFGGKKKKEEQPADQPPPQQQPQAQGTGQPLIEITTEVTSYSSAPIDASVFEVPAGYKQVEPEMKKQLNKMK
jgi:hypothetical protein